MALTKIEREYFKSLAESADEILKNKQVKTLNEIQNGYFFDDASLNQRILEETQGKSITNLDEVEKIIKGKKMPYSVTQGQSSYDLDIRILFLDSSQTKVKKDSSGRSPIYTWKYNMNYYARESIDYASISDFLGMANNSTKDMSP